MGRNLVCSDLHGRGDVWDEIKKFLRSDDMLYILGDSADRGPDGWTMIKEALNMSNVTYILGNHDMMLINRARNQDEWMHIANGGEPTWKGFIHDPKKFDYIDTLKRKPHNIIYTSKKGLKIFMNHSGSTSFDIEDQVWNRTHYLTDFEKLDYDLIIHGHTPIELMVKELDRAHKKYDWQYGKVCWYSNKRKVNIDCGTVWNGFTILLDLDTFEEHVIGEVGAP